MQVYCGLSLLLSFVKPLFEEGSDINLKMFGLCQRFAVLLSHLIEHDLVLFVLLGVEVEADGLVRDLSRAENVVHFLVIFKLKVEILDDVVGCLESLLMQLYLA